jgi:hypothetical protein
LATPVGLVRLFDQVRFPTGSLLMPGTNSLMKFELLVGDVEKRLGSCLLKDRYCKRIENEAPSL